MSKVGYFEIMVDDFSRAQDFYRSVFGWKFSKIDVPFQYYAIDTGHKGDGSINGGMMLREKPLTGNDGVTAFVSAIYVDSIDGTFKSIQEHGGAIALEKTAVPGMGYFAYGRDSEGNMFGLWERS